MKSAIQELKELLPQCLADHKLGSSGFSLDLQYGDLCLGVDSGEIVSILHLLRDGAALQFTTLVDICGVDWPEREQRFDVVYHLLSTALNQRLRVKVALTDGQSVPSVADIFPSAVWYEREAWDMYGILFSGSPDLRRILTDYGFSGHPLRKDFPLTGFVETRYDDEQRRIVQEPVSLVQDFRSFDFTSPWEGMSEVVMNKVAEQSDSELELAEKTVKESKNHG